MNKKLAILTQPLHTNYGGTLQAFALQKVISNMGWDVSTINYQNKPRNIQRFILSVIKGFILNRKDKFPLLPREKLVIEKNHADFIEKNIKRSELIFSESDIVKHFNNNDYGAIVIGSDQVWRVEYSPNIDNFFLNFYSGSAKRISYAASFGIDEWQFTPEKTLEIQKWLSRFDAISLREDSAVDLCDKYFNLKSEHVLDPTLLLAKENYEVLINEIPKKNKGIFTYVLDPNSDKQKIIEIVEKELDMDAFSSQPVQKIKKSFFIKNIDDYIYPKIEDWLASFRDASFVVTDSFHGTVFSIIFNKPFIVIANKERGSARFTSLLKLFNLENRLVSSSTELDSKLFSENIDYSNVNEILSLDRDRSKQYLLKALC